MTVRFLKHSIKSDLTYASGPNMGIKLILETSLVPIEINGTGMSSGTFEFIGSALVFHKTTGEPFTVTYTIEAPVKSLKE